MSSNTSFRSKRSSQSKSAYRFRTIAIASIALAACGLLPAGKSAGLLAPLVAEAQNFGQRTILGKVVADTGAPVGGATVFLKNLKSRNIKSFTSIPDGSYRFAQVGMIDDYEVWAEKGKLKSAVKTVSSYDSRKQLDFELRLK